MEVDVFADLLKINKRRKLPHIEWIVQHGLIYVHIVPLKSIWLTDYYVYNRSAYFLSRHHVLYHIRKQKGYMASGQNIQIGGKTCRCVVFSVREAPEALFELLGITKQEILSNVVSAYRDPRGVFCESINPKDKKDPKK